MNFKKTALVLVFCVLLGWSVLGGLTRGTDSETNLDEHITTVDTPDMGGYSGGDAKGIEHAMEDILNNGQGVQVPKADGSTTNLVPDKGASYDVTILKTWVGDKSTGIGEWTITGIKIEKDEEKPDKGDKYSTEVSGTCPSKYVAKSASGTTTTCSTDWPLTWSCSGNQKYRTRDMCYDGTCSATETDAYTCPYGCGGGKCLPFPQFTMSPSPAIPTQKVTLNAGDSNDSYLGKNLQYQWFFDSVAIPETLAPVTTPTVQTTVPTGKTSIAVKLEVTSHNLTGDITTSLNNTVSKSLDEGAKNSVTLTMPILSAPVPKINAPSECIVPCADADINAAGTTGISPMTFLWEYGDGTSTTVYDAAQPGKNHPNAYQGQLTGAVALPLTLTVTDSTGTASASQQITIINHAPTADFFMEPSSADGYIPLTVKFTDNSSDITDSHAITGWAWNFGDGTSSAEQNPTHVYADHEDIYTVTLIATDKYGASGTVQKTVNVRQRPLITGFKVTNPTTPNEVAYITINCSKPTTAKIEFYDKDNHPLTDQELPNISQFTAPFTCSSNTITPQFTNPGIYLIKVTLLKADGTPETECTNCPKTTNTVVGIEMQNVETPEMPAILAAGIALIVVLVVNRKK
ncbi:MAG: PKD domain-containing protein [Candidatus Diapherotrites archaeon]|nr:PKD domain-containing protein [Candidatus Diapherotrites archaeon]